jgi:DNA integrity scanning protein DisA with diadenylate cyclase activity
LDNSEVAAMTNFPTILTDDDVKAIRAMTPEQLVKHAQSLDFAVLVESTLRLDNTTRRLNGIVNWLTFVLVALTIVLVLQGFKLL